MPYREKEKPGDKGWKKETEKEIWELYTCLLLEESGEKEFVSLFRSGDASFNLIFSWVISGRLLSTFRTRDGGKGNLGL